MTEPLDIEETRRRLQEAEELLHAIRTGEVDALVIQRPGGGAAEEVYTLESADRPYRMLVEEMEEAALTLTPAGDVLYCNRRFAQLVNTPIEKIRGGPVTRYISEDDRLAFAALLSVGRGKHSGHLVAAGGTRVPVCLAVNKLMWAGVESLGLLVTDLSEITRSEIARADAEADSRAKDEFIAMLGHELRNPLGAIRSALAVLQQVGPREERMIRARDVLERQTLHLTRLVEDMLDIARVTTGKIGLSRKDIDLAEAVDQYLATLRTSGAMDQHVFAVETTPVWVSADPARFEQIIGNLMSNALKYTPPGGRIRITVAREGDHAVLRVVDTGLGIPADLLRRVFDLFVQGDRPIDRASGGLGLGLSLARRLVELHGGFIEAASGGAGQGSAFTVRLPALGIHSVAGPAPEPAAAPPARRRIVLIEDNEDSREMLRLWLEMEEHEVHVAAHGVEGLELVLRTHPDVVLVDVGLPEMDGYEVARRLRSTPGGDGLVLIALTGYGQPRDRERARDAGFNDHLVKPVDPKLLSRLLLQPPGSTPSR